MAYVTPASGTVTYHCALHPGETGSIVIQNVVPMKPISTVLCVIAVAGMSFLPARAQDGEHPGAHPGQHMGQRGVAAAPLPASQIPCLAPQQPLIRVPEVVSDSKAHRLRATLVSGTDQVRMTTRYANRPRIRRRCSPYSPAIRHRCRSAFPSGYAHFEARIRPHRIRRPYKVWMI